MQVAWQVHYLCRKGRKIHVYVNKKKNAYVRLVDLEQNRESRNMLARKLDFTTHGITDHWGKLLSFARSNDYMKNTKLGLSHTIHKSHFPEHWKL